MVRREGEGLRRYVHLATGNYNEGTSRLYTDLGLFTCDPEFGEDLSEFFNGLSGFSKKAHYRKLAVGRPRSGTRSSPRSRLRRRGPAPASRPSSSPS